MSFHTGQTFTYGEQPSATKWNYLWENDYALADGSGIEADAIDSTKIDFGGSGAGVWWEEIGRTTLGSAGNTIGVTSFTAKKYLKIFTFMSGSGGTIAPIVRFNNDSASNYNYRYSDNGGADTTATSQGKFLISGPSTYTAILFEAEILNVTALEKLMKGTRTTAAATGAGTATSKQETTGKWANTSTQISRIDVINDTGAGATGQFATGSELVILGHD